MNSAPSSSSKPAASSTCITSTVGATLRDCTSTLSTDCPTVLFTRASTASFARRTTAGVTDCPAGCAAGRGEAALEVDGVGGPHPLAAAVALITAVGEDARTLVYRSVDGAVDARISYTVRTDQNLSAAPAAADVDQRGVGEMHLVAEYLHRTAGDGDAVGIGRGRRSGVEFATHVHRAARAAQHDHARLLAQPAGGDDAAHIDDVG